MRNVAFLFEGIPLKPRKLSVSSSCCRHEDLQGRQGHYSALPSNAAALIHESPLNSILPPMPVGGRQVRCSLLWLRMGSLRLGDNCAVKAAAAQEGFLLPVITVQRRYLTSSCMAAISAMANSFQALQSTVIVRAVDNEVGAEFACIREVATRAHAKNVFVNEGFDMNALNVSHLRNGQNMKVHVVSRIGGSFPGLSSLLNGGSSGAICDPPIKLPHPPPLAHSFSSNLGLEGVRPKGENAARVRLRHLLKSQRYPESKSELLSSLVNTLSEELRIGCLCPARVLYELNQRQYGGNFLVKGNAVKAKHGFSTNLLIPPTVSALSIAAYDVNGGDRRGVEWDNETNAFILKEWEHTENERRMNPRERWQEFWRRRRSFFMRSFFPEDVTPDYYSFTAWRFAQRCVSATIGVFGTSSLLFAIGIRSGRIGQAAVISWVLKDGLGRVGKMIWAGSMGKDFDVDPKRWRFRSALLYALGNGLEIVTQIFPASFLLFATAANSMKQVSMLTASATRNAMYRSFGGRSQNIANITAKGEAQIVVADLIGMGCGIRLSKILGASKQHVLGMYLTLTCLDIFGIYMELRQVVFRTLNAERSSILVNHYIRHGDVMTPSDVSPRERIFMKPRYMSQIRLSSIAKAARDPEEMDLLLSIFKREHFIVSTPGTKGGGPCRLVLRKGATNDDVLRAILMIGYVHQHLKAMKKKSITLEDEEYILRSSWKSSKRHFPVLMQGAREAGWNTDSLLFNTMKRRGYW